MVIFDSTQRKVIDLALTRFGKPDMFDDITLERIATQDKAFSKPKLNIGKMQFMAVVPLAIIALLLYTRTGRK